MEITPAVKTLAHYTVLPNEVYNLHLFEFRPNGAYTHYKADKETADTYFVEGLLIICPPLSATQIETIAHTISNRHNLSLNETALAISRMLPEFECTTPVRTYQAVYPDYILTPLPLHIYSVKQEEEA